MKLKLIAVCGAALALAACGSGTVPKASNGTPASAVGTPTSTVSSGGPTSATQSASGFNQAPQSTTATTSSSQPAGPAPDACSLFSAGEASRALGQSLRAVSDTFEQAEGTICTYVPTGSNPDTSDTPLTIVSEHSADGGFATVVSGLATNAFAGAAYLPAVGIGHNAVWGGTYAHSVLMTVHGNFFKITESSGDEASSVAIAKVVAARA